MISCVYLPGPHLWRAPGCERRGFERSRRGCEKVRERRGWESGKVWNAKDSEGRRLLRSEPIAK